MSDLGGGAWARAKSKKTAQTVSPLGFFSNPPGLWTPGRAMWEKKMVFTCKICRRPHQEVAVLHASSKARVRDAVQQRFGRNPSYEELVQTGGLWSAQDAKSFAAGLGWVDQVNSTKASACRFLIDNSTGTQAVHFMCGDCEHRHRQRAPQGAAAACPECRVLLGDSVPIRSEEPEVKDLEWIQEGEGFSLRAIDMEAEDEAPAGPGAAAAQPGIDQLMQQMQRMQQFMMQQQAQQAEFQAQVQAQLAQRQAAAPAAPPTNQPAAAAPQPTRASVSAMDAVQARVVEDGMWDHVADFEIEHRQRRLQRLSRQSRP